MDKYQSLADVAEQIGDETGTTPQTVGQLVDKLIEFGRDQYDQHDDFLGMKINLPNSFLALPIDAVNPERHEEHGSRVLDEANTIFRNLEIGEYKPTDED